MATINFTIRTKVNPAKIYVRLKNGRKADIKVVTNYLVNPENWSNNKGKPKHTKDESLKALDSKLEKLRVDIVDRLNEINTDESVNTKWLKDIVTPSKKSNEQYSSYPEQLNLYFDYFIQIIEDRVLNKETSINTLRNYQVNKRLLERFLKETDNVVLIKDVNLKFKAHFSQYCLKHGYALNTIAKAVKVIKTVCRDARMNGIETHSQLDSIKSSYQDTESIYLTFEELDLIESIELPDYLDNARDWLIISCYTGQRISDFLRFEKSMLRVEKNRTYIEFKQQKTGKKIAIPVHPKVKAILDERNGDFPRRISDQKYNSYIKEACRQAGLTYKVKGRLKKSGVNRLTTGMFEKWELVASHIGRRSFATNFYGAIPTGLLKAATGHSTEKQFLEYIGKSDTEQAKQLAEYF